MRFAVSLMSKLSYPKKMAVIAAIFLFPLTITFVSLVNSLNSGINASILEKKRIRVHRYRSAIISKTGSTSWAYKYLS